MQIRSHTYGTYVILTCQYTILTCQYPTSIRTGTYSVCICARIQYVFARFCRYVQRHQLVFDKIRAQYVQTGSRINALTSYANPTRRYQHRWGGSTPTTPLLSVRGCEWSPTPLSCLTSTQHMTNWRGCKLRSLRMFTH